MAIEWRALTETDIPAWAQLARAVEAADHEDEHYSEEDLAEEYHKPLFDPRRGSLAGFDGATMAAFGMLRVQARPGETHRMGYFGAVHPEYRGQGLGVRLMNWAPEAARPLHREHHPDRPLVLSTGCISTNTAAAALFERFGYRPVRYYHGMRRALDADLPQVAAIEQIEIVPYSRELDEQALLVKNESFKDHWGSTPTTPEQWRSAYAESASFRPDLSFLALRGGEPAGDDAADDDTADHDAGDGFGRVVGLAITKYYEAATQATGERDAYIAVVGTLRSARKRGIATALLGTVLHAARAAGFDSASLGVDSQNPSGALGIYERAGLTVTDTWINYALDL